MKAIEVAGVSKTFRQYQDTPNVARRLLRPFQRRRVTRIDALKDISFAVERGGTLGIIGRNGSGKTTLLTLLSGVSGPTAGRVRVVGSVAPLIGIGVGFNPELTGRENVYVNGRLLGMTAREVEQKFDDIVEFSEIPEFLDTPVKFYSSGMFLRLAFSIAIHTEPDIMVVDEILAVGDAGFQAKCDEKLREIRSSGATIVIVTHNLAMVERMSARTLLLDNGVQLYDGDTQEAVRRYLKLIRDQATHRAPSGDAAATITADVIDRDGRPTEQLTFGEPIRMRIHVEFATEVSGVSLGIALDRTGFGRVYAIGTDPRGYERGHGPGTPLIAEVELAPLPLKSGEYNVRLVVRGLGIARPLAMSLPVHFHVAGTSSGMGLVDFDASFRFNGDDVPARQAGLVSVEEDPVRDL